MQLPWVAKAFAFQFLRLCPRSVHEFLSTRVTGRGVRVIDAYVDNPRRHARQLAQHLDPARDRVLEFGAGRDLFDNLVLAALGFRNQLAVDIEPLLRREAVNSLLVQPYFAGLHPPLTEDCIAELRALGIDYRAPFDMRATGLADATVAAVISTSTLEHVPPEDIAKILVECRRVLLPGGICSFLVDYSDHYCHTDHRINSYNFLRFSGRTWGFFSPPNHYQNRLRHPAYIELFRAAGFELLEAQPERPPAWKPELESVRVAPEFSRYDVADLSWTSAWFLLRKA